MTMLEKAARALCELDDMDWNSPVLDETGVIVGSIRDELYAQARAVLMSIREPDDRALDAGALAGPDTNAGEFGYGDAHAVFAAMIDAILTESDNPA